MMLGDKIAKTPRRGHRNPAHAETKRFELLPQLLADLLDAHEVHRSAVDIDQLLQEGDAARVVGLRMLHNCALDIVLEQCSGYRGLKHEPRQTYRSACEPKQHRVRTQLSRRAHPSI